MNRTTALFLALALLLAHCLAIYQTALGDFAMPYESAHAAWRIARNLVYQGTPAWNPGEPLTESYPSPLWVALLAVGQRIYLAPNHLTQAVGLLSALGTVVVVAGFSRDRLAGIIAPAFLVVNGALAAAATDGTEAAFFALLLASAFLAYERESPRLLSVLLSLALLTRSEGALFAIALFAIEALRVARRRDPERKPQLRAFLLPAGVQLLLTLARARLTGFLLSPTEYALFTDPLGSLSLGLSYLAENAVLFGSPLLVCAPIYYTLRGGLKDVGRRALALAVFMSAVVVLEGGSSLPYANALLPALPLLYVAIQEALIVAMDSRRRGLELLAWLLFVGSLMISVSASMRPDDFGILKSSRWMQARLRPGPQLAEAWDRPLGRMGLAQEIAETQRLRRLSTFLRHRLDPGVSILSPWPGAIGYLSRRRVYDLLGRAGRSYDGGQLQSWCGAPRVDVVAILSGSPDYIVPTIEPLERPPLLLEVASEWMRRYDIKAEAPGWVQRYRDVLRPYELISVPIPITEDPWSGSNTTFYLLRRKELGLGPTLELELEDSSFRVAVRHRGHQQIANLEVRVEDREGRSWWLRPTGEFVQDQPSHARAGVLLSSSAERSVLLVEGRIPDWLDPATMAAVLRNPGSQAESSFSVVSEQARHVF